MDAINNEVASEDCTNNCKLLCLRPFHFLAETVWFEDVWYDEFYLHTLKIIVVVFILYINFNLTGSFLKKLI